MFKSVMAIAILAAVAGAGVAAATTDQRRFEWMLAKSAVPEADVVVGQLVAFDTDDGTLVTDVGTCKDFEILPR